MYQRVDRGEQMKHAAGQTVLSIAASHTNIQTEQALYQLSISPIPAINNTVAAGQVYSEM